jgi:predicted ATPase/class 3 adenylate cyclase
MLCRACGADNPDAKNFCGDCGAALTRPCPHCSAANPPNKKFCRDCGVALTELPRTNPAGHAAPETIKKSRKRLRHVDSEKAAAARLTIHDGERRQLTVMFCDLIGSTALSERLDPEELRELMRTYHQSCARIILRFEGYLAKYLGDGLLVYFGYPQAHEDDAHRAVRAGLAIIRELEGLNPADRPPGTRSIPLRVRIGIHTGPVVVGEMGAGDHREPAAIVGETPNVAARIQQAAQPATVIISAATQRLIRGFFTFDDLGPTTLNGISNPMRLYVVRGESGAQSRFEAALSGGLTPLVGREEEVRSLLRHWEQAQRRSGQVVLLSGEAGIGKSRLVQVLKEQVLAGGGTAIELHCSPYHRNSAFHPIIEHLQRLLQFEPQEPAVNKLAKLEKALRRYRFPQPETLILLAGLLSLPNDEGCYPLSLSRQKQKQKTQEALVAWLVEEAELRAVYCAWEDLHWADPSTLEVLTLFLDQIPTTRLLAVLSFRSDFIPPWRPRSYLSQLTLNRLQGSEVEAMVQQVAGGKSLPSEIIQQIVRKTDGVPLFVEELVKMVLESRLLNETEDRYELTRPLPPLAIPSTLQDSLMARLDRLSTAREIAQTGATLGREFSYELLRAVSPVDDAWLQQGLQQLVEAELLYQRGMPPEATYLFKHALVQDTAYQSLLKSRRQQLHQQIAQVLEQRFRQTVEIQPELIAHHYTEAGLLREAIPYWQRAGQRAVERSAHAEAIGHLNRGLALLQALPEASARLEQELHLRITLGAALIATKGQASPDVEKTYNRARELCQQLSETSQLFSVLLGLRRFYLVQVKLRIALELGEQLLRLASEERNSALLVEAHEALGLPLFWLGELPRTRAHLEQGIALYDPQHHRFHVSRHGQDPGVLCRLYEALTLWHLGYPDRALQSAGEAVAFSQRLSHPYTSVFALFLAAWVHQYRREAPAARELAERMIALSEEYGFLFWLAEGAIFRGAALVEQGKLDEGLKSICQGVSAHQATGVELARPYFLGLLADAYEKTGQKEQSWAALTEALTLVNEKGERMWEAELYRLKGTLVLQGSIRDAQTVVASSQAPGCDVLRSGHNFSVEIEAERYFQQSIKIARRQHARSLELRASISLARLWQQQGNREGGRQMLEETYLGFSEGFETKDLQEAKILLGELA